MRRVQVTRITICVGVVALTLGILWVSDRERTPLDASPPQDSQKIALADDDDGQESIWGQFIPKSLAQQRSDRRLALQEELATLIEGQAGIEHAHVLLSLQENRGLGHRFKPSTACVTMMPSSTTRLTVEAIESVTHLVASGVPGLSAKDVTVVDNRDGTICSGRDQLVVHAQMSSGAIRRAVEDALGLIVATVEVNMISPPEGVMFIPWVDNKKPSVQLTLPRSWITRRASQVGSVNLVMDNITQITKEAAPGAIVEISIINDPVGIIKSNQPIESHAKQWVLIIGLVALLLSGLTVRSRKPDRGKTHIPVMSVSQEAAYILTLPHSSACNAIDALVGVHRQAVLLAISESEDIPIIEVPSRRVADLIRCG